MAPALVVFPDIAMGLGNDILRSMALRQMVTFASSWPGACVEGASTEFCVRAHADRRVGQHTGGSICPANGRFIKEPHGWRDYGNAILLTPDNSFYVVGGCSDDFCFEGFNHVTAAPITRPGTTTAIGPSTDMVSSAHFQPDGKVVVVGECDNASKRP